MHSSDLGPAMALSGARDEGARQALKVAAEAADRTAERIDVLADGLSDAHDRTAVKNAAVCWRIFALELRKQIR